PFLEKAWRPSKSLSVHMNKLFGDFRTQLSIRLIGGGQFQFKPLGLHVPEELLDGSSNQFAEVLFKFSGCLVGTAQQGLWEFNQNALFARAIDGGLSNVRNGHRIRLSAL